VNVARIRRTLATRRFTKPAAASAESPGSYLFPTRPMAVPKRRTSKRKKRARNTHKTAPAIAIQKCPRCQAMKRPHHVCAECGYYAGEQRVAAKEA
jgi:large subunit ribosomal protein L32